MVGGLEKKLIENGFDFYNFKNSRDFNSFLVEDIDKSISIYFGGSKTVDEIGTFEYLNNKGYNLNWHWREGKELRNKTVSEEKYYITSSNALSQDGKLINMDGLGNRVAAMIRGYERVYVVVGKNKLVEDVEAGRERIKKIAAPLNAKRLRKDTPCVLTGVCMDCRSRDRICRAELVLHRNPMDSKIIVCLIDEELGY